MSRENNGGPAFPSQGYEGLTIRDYVAIKAMQGWLASYGESDRHPAANASEDYVARLSYKMADAMLKAREEV